MKRSAVNALIADAEDYCGRMNFMLPPFAHYRPQDWDFAGGQLDEIAECMLGWDITDFGMGDYEKVGLLLFTIRNGSASQPLKYPKPYCEKLLLVGEGQVTPWHCHIFKQEDIINRGGGILRVRVCSSNRDGVPDREAPVTVNSDGRVWTTAGETELDLQPGASITLPQGQYHTFWGVGGRVLCGEVSRVNDDITDNRFLEKTGRFPDIDEDEPPLRLLCTDYAAYGGK